jgi:ribosomal protein S18 acetylase RimI-like enzyme
MPGVLAPPRPLGTTAETARTLNRDDVPSLRLPDPRSRRSLSQLLEARPGRSVWVPETLEYLALGAWRNRQEISSVEEFVAVRNAEPLLRAAFERCVARGDHLLLAIELESHRGPSRFERAGLGLLEEVITYEVQSSQIPVPAADRARLIPVHATDRHAIDRVVRIDQTAFPWLWRNSRAELDVYLRTPEVEVSLVEAEGEAVAYIGATLFPGWGHLDRIAVAPEWQGQGLGREALTLAVDAMRRRGARRVALSTQRTNWRSQRLYERFGFRRTPELDYQLFGAWRQADLDESPASQLAGFATRP